MIYYLTIFFTFHYIILKLKIFSNICDVNLMNILINNEVCNRKHQC